MPPKKKGKGKKTKKQENRPDVLTEVDKTFYELQITDLNRKLARLKQSTQEIEDKNQHLEDKLVNLDEDRADVISFLKRTVSVKQNESLELQERLTALQETKESDTKEFETKISELETENKTIREQLTSEIKLINGKLNALEEFRMQRDDLMEKFQEQEKIIQEQEIREKRVIYEIEKKFIISKKNITSEMEQQLLTLANNFEKANQVRIAATTQRCIRENIMLNNELNNMVVSLENLNQQVEDYKIKNTELKLNCELYQAERNKTINELQMVRNNLEQMTKDYQVRVKTLRSYENEMKKNQKMHEEMRHVLERENVLAAKIRILEQNIHAVRCKEIDLKQLITKQNKLVYYFQEVNREAIIAIEDCLKISLHPRLDEAGKQYKRDLLLQNLLKILTQPEIDTHTILSMDSIKSIDSKYKRGDLGFLPKEVHHSGLKDKNQMLNAAVQVTPRYDESSIFLRNASSDSQSDISPIIYDATGFYSCSVPDVTNTDRSLFKSMVIPGRFVSDIEIDKMLSKTSFNNLSDTTTISKDISSDEIVTSQLNIEMKSIIEENIEDYENEEQENEESLEECFVEDEENTVFGNTEDELDPVYTSPED